MRAFASLACLPILLSSIAFAAEKETYKFPNGRQAGQIDRVTCRLEVGGEVKHIADKKEHRNKMSVDCNLAYEEKTLAVAADPKGVTRSARYYETAEGVVKNGDDGFKPTLREERKLIGAEINEQSVLLYSPKGSLTWEELELIVVLGNSLLLDRCLPENPVAVGESWKHSEKLMAQFLGLDEVGQSDVHSTLTEVDDKNQVARFKLKGHVAGAVDGVTTEIEIEANYRYDLRRNRIDWLGLLVKEQRQTSPVTDGFDVAAKLSIQIKPREASANLSDAALKDVSFESTPELLQLEHHSKLGNWSLAYDRQWNLAPNAQDKAVLRLIDRGEYVAQCTLTSLPASDPQKLVALETFQEDLRKALDKNFGEFVEASESPGPTKNRVLRVAIRGTVSELPMRWIYYHVADPKNGRQAVFVFVVEEKLYDRLAGADKKLVDSFRFAEPQK